MQSNAALYIISYIYLKLVTYLSFQTISNFVRFLTLCSHLQTSFSPSFILYSNKETSGRNTAYFGKSRDI